MTTCYSCGVSVLSRRGPRGPNTRQGRAVGMPRVEPFIGSGVFGREGNAGILTGLGTEANFFEERYELGRPAVARFAPRASRVNRSALILPPDRKFAGACTPPL